MAKIFNRYYKDLRRYVFPTLSSVDFFRAYDNFNRLRKQYKILKICNFIEKIHVPLIEFPFLRFFTLLLDFLRWKFYDILMSFVIGRQFKLYGVTMFCGRQGSGKTIGIVEYLDRMREIYPDCLICTNFGYLGEDIALVDWRQLLETRNGTKGIIFAIDEFQNEYDNSKWKDFPDNLLSVITQQRKQRIKIVLSSQVYTRVVKQIREQCYEVAECKTFSGRWTRLKVYDATDYEYLISVDDPRKRFKVHKKYKYTFIQSNFLRNRYNSYAVVDRMKKSEFIPRDERGYGDG